VPGPPPPPPPPVRAATLEHQDASKQSLQLHCSGASHIPSPSHGITSQVVRVTAGSLVLRKRHCLGDWQSRSESHVSDASQVWPGETTLRRQISLAGQSSSRWHSTGKGMGRSAPRSEVQAPCARANAARVVLAPRRAGRRAAETWVEVPSMIIAPKRKEGPMVPGASRLRKATAPPISR